MTEFILKKYNIQSTGANGGHNYLKTEIEYKGKIRKLVVLFANKTDEQNLKENTQIRIKGQLQDDGEKYDLVMNMATLEK